MDDQVTLRVYFLDGTSLGIGCTRLSTVGEVRDLVVAKLRLPPAHAACFELYVAPERGPLCDELPRRARSHPFRSSRSANPPFEPSRQPLTRPRRAPHRLAKPMILLPFA